MKVTLAALADYAAVTDKGKLVIAGVFETINAAKLPAVHPMMAIVVRIAADPGEPLEHMLTMRLIDPDGADVIPPLETTVAFHEVDQFAGARTQIILNIPGVRLAKAGGHRVDILVDGRLEHSLDLHVILVPQPDTAPPGAAHGSD